jgi:hypothetical protein
LIAFEGTSAMTDPNSAFDRAAKFLDIVRNEFRQRVELKQQVLNAYLVGLAAIFAFVFHDFFSHPEVIYILWIVPFMSLATAAFFADHMLVTTSLSNYIKHQLESALLTEPLKVEFWDRADQSHELVRTFGLLSFVQSCVVCLPSVAVIIVEWQFSNSRDGKLALDNRLNSILYVYATVCIITSVILMVIIHKESKTKGPATP